MSKNISKRPFKDQICYSTVHPKTQVHVFNGVQSEIPTRSYINGSILTPSKCNTGKS